MSDKSLVLIVECGGCHEKHRIPVTNDEEAHAIVTEHKEDKICDCGSQHWLWDTEKADPRWGEWVAVR